MHALDPATRIRLLQAADDFDAPAWRERRDAKLLEWFRGDAAAVSCVLKLGTIAEVWDDLVDQDTPVPVQPGHINMVFILALLELPTDPFWHKHVGFLFPILVVSINAWLDANDLEKDPLIKWRQLAFHLRNTMTELVPAVAYCIGGLDLMRAVSLEARQFFAHETFDQWEHRHEPR